MFWLIFLVNPFLQIPHSAGVLDMLLPLSYIQFIPKQVLGLTNKFKRIQWVEKSTRRAGANGYTVEPVWQRRGIMQRIEKTNLNLRYQEKQVCLPQIKGSSWAAKFAGIAVRV